MARRITTELQQEECHKDQNYHWIYTTSILVMKQERTRHTRRYIHADDTAKAAISAKLDLAKIPAARNSRYAKMDKKENKVNIVKFQVIAIGGERRKSTRNLIVGRTPIDRNDEVKY